jgi:hypothetical protein
VMAGRKPCGVCHRHFAGLGNRKQAGCLFYTLRQVVARQGDVDAVPPRTVGATVPALVDRRVDPRGDGCLPRSDRDGLTTAMSRDCPFDGQGRLSQPSG